MNNRDPRSWLGPLRALATAKGEGESKERQPLASNGNNIDKNHYFKNSQWTADGTSIITDSSDNLIQTFVIPPNLLEERDDQLILQPYTTIPCVEPVRALTLYPLFQLQNPSTTLLLCSFRDHPVRLHSALSPDLLASYALINPTTEAFTAPHSLTFTPDGGKFVGGSKNLLATFDLTRPGNEPLRVRPVSRSSKRSRGDSGIGMNGIISALAIDPASNLLAAGTFTREVGLFDAAGQGECLGVFNVKGNEADSQIGGGGITQLMWSTCGRYLYVAERRSDGIMVYDIRKTGQLLSWAAGRNATTNQRLGIDIAPFMTENAKQEIWAGGIDGTVRVWTGAHLQEGSCQPAFQWQAHEDAVSSTVLHSSGSVVACCSGQRHFDEDNPVTHGDIGLGGSRSMNHGSRMAQENSLRLWALE